MRLLLDTHVLLWAVSDASRLSPPALAADVVTADVVTAVQLVGGVSDASRLSPPALAAFQNPANRLHISAATIWEIAIKVGLGKLTLNAPYRPWIETAIQKFSLSEFPVTIQYADTQTRLPFHHNDPFDRLIIAQALTERIPVISVDTRFDAYGVTRIWT